MADHADGSSPSAEASPEAPGQGSVVEEPTPISSSENSDKDKADKADKAVVDGEKEKTGESEKMKNNVFVRFLLAVRILSLIHI